MANDYKKRLKGNWRQGKGYKGDDSERAYAKKEISEDLKAIDEEYLTKHKGKRKKNVKAHLEYLIAWYTQRVEEIERSKNRSSMGSYWRDGLAKARKRLGDFLEKEKDKK